MKTAALPSTNTHRRQIVGLIVIVGLEAALLLQSVIGHDPVADRWVVLPTLRLRNYTLTYYRAPEHTAPSENPLDPYDSFLKDSNGDLLVTPTGTNKVSSFAKSVFMGYILKTHKGTSIIVYQETPSRHARHKSNSHGFTFLNGDYWLLGSQVAKILDDNGWAPVSSSNVRAGDVAVYRERTGRIVHSARVVGRDPRGLIRVDSKSGFEPEETGVPAGAVVPD